MADVGASARSPADDVMLTEPQPEPEFDDDETSVGGAGELSLRLDGFAGSLDLLLEMARIHRIDLKTVDLLAVVEQLIQATRAETGMALNRKAAWNVTASWLLLLRSNLMLPRADPRQPAAAERVQQLQARLLSLQEVRALARWLDERPQLGRDVFECGASEAGPAARPEAGGGDRVEFLWACIALFEGDWPNEALVLSDAYVPRPADVYTVEEARARVRRRMAGATPTARVSLADLLPQQEIDRPLASREAPASWTRHRSAWSSTLMACLEMAKQGELVVEQRSVTEMPDFRSP